MAKAHVTPLHARHDDTALKEIYFTRRCRDLLVRAGLEGMYLTRFIRNNGTAVVYGLTLDQTEALQSALDELRGEAAHYDKTSLTALERELKRVLYTERTKGLLPDPGLDVTYSAVALLLRDIPSPARLHVGDRVVNAHLGEATIIEPYGFYRATCRTGRFYDKDGERLDYVWGYGIRTIDGQCCVSHTGDLSGVDGRRLHLQLVQSDNASFSTTGGGHD